jgi:hypothetical protein
VEEEEEGGEEEARGKAIERGKEESPRTSWHFV